ncbi:hypothetical protein SAMN02910358_02059, partial [Lachnospiraceae bacterium XBB1006]
QAAREGRAAVCAARKKSGAARGARSRWREGGFFAEYSQNPTVGFAFQRS